MIGVKRFDRVEAGGGKRRNAWAETELAGVRDRRDAARLVDDLDDRVGRRTSRGHEAGAARGRASGRTPHACSATCPASTIARATCGRPIERPLSRLACSHHRLDVDRHAKRREARADRLDARNSCRALRDQKRRQAPRAGVEQVAEHVEVAALLDGGDFDAATAWMPCSAGRCATSATAAVVS